MLHQRLVDLPGYGYAAVPEAMKKEWQSELEKYLISRKSLTGLVLLTDIRHPLKFFDEITLEFSVLVLLEPLKSEEPPIISGKISVTLSITD